MNIGEFKNINGQLLGSIATAAIHLPRLGLRPIQSDNAKAPKYEVVTLNGRVWVQVGAVWEAASNSSGELFLQGSIDDPSFAAPLQIACFGNVEEGYRVAWTRNRRRQSGFGQIDGMGSEGMAPSEAGEGGDAFEGNANDDGGLIEGGANSEGGEAQTGRRGRRSQPASEEVPAFS